MANKKIKHIVAKLLGESTEETLDIYDESALHATDIVDNLTSTDATKVLSAKQGKALNDSITNLDDSLSKFGWFHLCANQSASTTLQTYTTINSRKFSDYNLIALNYVDSNGSFTRTGLVIPSTLFGNVALSNNDATNTQHYVDVSKVSDTSFSLRSSSNAVGYKVNIQGIKIMK